MRDDLSIVWTGHVGSRGQRDCPWAALDRVLDRIRSDPRWRGEMRAARRWAARYTAAPNEEAGAAAFAESVVPPHRHAAFSGGTPPGNPLRRPLRTPQHFDEGRGSRRPVPAAQPSARV
jgi:hypothetical protein